MRSALFPILLVMVLCPFTLFAAEPRVEVATKEGSMQLQAACQWMGKAEVYQVTFANLLENPIKRAVRKAQTMNATVVQVIYSFAPAENEACGRGCVVRFWTCP